jgi:hypothetical protein
MLMFYKIHCTYVFWMLRRDFEAHLTFKENKKMKLSCFFYSL